MGRHKTNRLERFKSKIKRLSECWEWTGCVFYNGYGVFRDNNKNLRAHRVAYELFISEIPQGLFVLHRCDNRRCVNPKHLWLGNHLDNMGDMAKKGRRHDVRGARNPQSKISANDVAYIRRVHVGGRNRWNPGNGAFLARKFKISQSHVNLIAQRKTWAHLIDKDTPKHPKELKA